MTYQTPILTAPVDVEAWAWHVLKDLGGITVWALTADTSWPYRVEVTTLQIDARASNKQRSRERALDVRRTLLDPDTEQPEDGVVSAVRPLTGPLWLPDDNGRPRYVTTVQVVARPHAAAL